MPLFNKKTENLKDKTVLCYDLGIFTEMAAALVKDFKKVYYYVPWADAFPSSNKQKIGIDFKGLTRIQNFWEYVDKVDLIVSFDTYSGDLIDYLRDMGYRVWGAGSAEALELKRWEMRKKQFEIGLPTQPTLRLKSIDDMETYFRGIRNEVKDNFGKEDTNLIKSRLKFVMKKYGGFSDEYFVGGDKKTLMKEWIDGAEHKFVKSNVRGDIESFHASNYDSSMSKFRVLKEQFGHRFDAREVEFVIEDKIKGIEPGFDGIQIDGKYLSPTMWGFEVKGGMYLGRVLPYKELPQQVRFLNDTLAKLLASHAPTSSFFSSEFIIAKDEKPYLIDPTVRNPAPVGSAIYSEIYKNLGEIIWNGARGEVVTPKFLDYKYAAGVSIDSSWADEHELEIEIDAGFEKFVKLRKAYMKGKKTYAVSGFSSIGSVIGFGNTIDKAIAHVKENVEHVKAYSIDVNLGTFDDIREELTKLKEITGAEF